MYLTILYLSIEVCRLVYYIKIRQSALTLPYS